jgi:hypothetical protein
MRKMFFAGFCLLVCSVAAYAPPPPPRVPEIDAGSLSAMLTLVGGCILMLRAKSRSK